MLGRILVAAVFLGFLIATLLIPSLGWVMVAFIGAAGAFCVQEIRRMFKERGVRIRKRIAIAGVLLLVAEGAFFRLEHSIYVLGMIACSAFAYRLLSATEGAFRDITATIGVVVYIGIPSAIWAAVILTRGEAHVWGALALAVIFATDSFALFVGKAVGKNKLIPTVSPGKTIEGSLGGFLGAFIAVAVARFAFPDKFGGIPIWELALFGFIFCIVGQVGDLAESLLKRDAGVKDSGIGKLGTLGGHGGFLDLLDAVLFAGIPLAVYLRVLHPGVLAP